MDAMLDALEIFFAKTCLGVSDPARYVQHRKNYFGKLEQYGMTYDDLEHFCLQVKSRIPNEIAYARKQAMHTPSTRYIEEMLALQISVRKGDEKFVRLLLYYGADPNSRDSHGNVPLWEAMVGRHEKVIKLLLANGANLFSGDMGRFACTAVEKNDLDLLKEIILYGADITLPDKDEDGSNALEVAAMSRNEEIVQFLLDQGAYHLHGQNAKEYIEQKDLERWEDFRMKRPELFTCGPKFVRKHDMCAKCRNPFSIQNHGKHSPRVTISCLNSGSGPKLVGLPRSLEELLDLSAAKFGIISTKVLTADKAEIDDICLIRDGDHLILACDDYWSETNNQNAGN